MGLRGVSYRGGHGSPPPFPVKSVQSIRSRDFKSGLGMLAGGFWCLVWCAVCDFPMFWCVGCVKFLAASVEGQPIQCGFN